MTTPKRRYRFLTLGILIVICAAAGLSGCTSTVKVKYVNWDVQFEKGTSELDKAIAIDSIRRYLLYSLAAQRDTMLYLRIISISINNNRNLQDLDRAPVGVEASFSTKSVTAVPPPKPPGTGPGQGLIHLVPPPIPTIPHVSNIAERSEEH